jgi:hypothetical protein
MFGEALSDSCSGSQTPMQVICTKLTLAASDTYCSATNPVPCKLDSSKLCLVTRCSQLSSNSRQLEFPLSVL